MLLFLNCGAHVLIFVTSTNPGLFAISANNVVKGEMYYTIISAAFTHGGLMHIGFNMMSLLQLGPNLELQFGTSQFLYMSIWSVFLCGFLYIFISYLCFWVTGRANWLDVAAVGYSGVLFTYATLETYHSNVDTRSIFGIFNVPAKLYPWVLLVVLSLVMPNISFLGHLSGILVGVLIVAGFFNLIIPSRDFQKESEQYVCCSILYKQENYIRCIDASMTIPDFFHATDGVSGWMRPILVGIQQVYFVVEFFLHVCGCPTARLATFFRSLIPSSSSLVQGLGSVGASLAVTGASEERAAADGRGSFRSVPTSAVTV